MFLMCEGRHWRYEVCEHADGYLVQMRDVDTGELEDEFTTVFRTMPVAFAYAEMSAAFDRLAAAEAEPSGEDAEMARDLAVSEQSFVALSERLGDGGVHGTALKAWERQRAGSPRRVLN